MATVHRLRQPVEWIAGDTPPSAGGWQLSFLRLAAKEHYEMSTESSINSKPGEEATTQEADPMTIPDKPVICDAEKYKLLRDELTYEANLITQRTTWFVASQAFFFTSLAIALNRSENVTFALENSLLFPMIPVVSLIVCITTFIAILAGNSAANKVRAQLGPPFPKRRRLIVVFGLLPSFVLPIAFALCWIFILCKWV